MHAHRDHRRQVRFADDDRDLVAAWLKWDTTRILAGALAGLFAGVVMMAFAMIFAKTMGQEILFPVKYVAIPVLGGEALRFENTTAVIVGFIGAMIIIRPGFSALHLGVLCILISTPIFSASNLISKSLARTDSAETIVAWQHCVIVVCAAPVAFWFWQTPSWIDLVWFLGAGLAGTLGHICQQRGYQIADITLLQPIGFLSLIWNTLLGYFLFFQKPDVWTFVGVAAAISFLLKDYLGRSATGPRAASRWGCREGGKAVWAALFASAFSRAASCLARPRSIRLTLRIEIS